VTSTHARTLPRPVAHFFRDFRTHARVDGRGWVDLLSFVEVCLEVETQTIAPTPVSRHATSPLIQLCLCGGRKPHHTYAAPPARHPLSPPILVAPNPAERSAIFPPSPSAACGMASPSPTHRSLPFPVGCNGFWRLPSSNAWPRGMGRDTHALADRPAPGGRAHASPRPQVRSRSAFCSRKRRGSGHGEHRTTAPRHEDRGSGVSTSRHVSLSLPP
jgi:hypothetical protein